MARSAAVALLLCLAAVSAHGRLFQDGIATGIARQLQQVNQRCPAGCATDGCVLDSTSGGYKCTKCQGSLTVNADNGKCECPAGRYANANTAAPTCLDCDKGAYCPGGEYIGASNPNKEQCATDLTTIGKRSTSIKACVNVPGTFYGIDGTGAPVATTCPVNTYGPGLRKQRACVPCPPGYTTQSQTGRTTARQCVVPEGYYLKGPGQVAPCPKGEYKSGFLPAPSCDKCANGVSTVSEASISVSNCTEVLPTFYPANITNGVVTQTQKCPQKFYCPGGSPKQAFTPTDLSTITDTTVVQCDKGTWTENIGASSADQCMTPPGFKNNGTHTIECGDGEYRADWKPAAAATSCQRCGDDILSSATEQITEYAVTPDATPSAVYVRASASACYIRPGQGMYFSAASSTYRAANCETDQYGVSNITYGLAAYPCRDCPAGMQTSTDLPNSNGYKQANGFTSPLACVTKAGYGYNGRVANKCPAGSYNAAGNYGTCTQCPVGLSTVDDAAQQTSSAACFLAPGYGFHDGAIQPCPIGTYNSDLRNSTTAECDVCTTGLSTAVAGARSSDDCDVCSAGYGESGCQTACGSTHGANFGPAGRQKGSACETCPVMVTGFSFDYLGQNQNFTPAAVARPQADSPADCLAEFAQIADAAWQMGGGVSLTNVTGVTSFADCVTACKNEATCQYITYDYDAAAGSGCSMKTVSANGQSGDVVAFKAVVAGDTTAASTKIDNNNSAAKGLSSGSYTFWKEVGTDLGATREAVNGVRSVQECLNACDNDFDCAAVAMTGTPNDMKAAPTTCTMIKGDKTIAAFKRSMTKTVATRLELGVAFA